MWHDSLICDMTGLINMWDDTHHSITYSW